MSEQTSPSPRAADAIAARPTAEAEGGALEGTILEPQDRVVGEFVPENLATRVSTATLKVGDPSYHPAVAKAVGEQAGFCATSAQDLPFDPRRRLTDWWAVCRVRDLMFEAARAGRQLLRAIEKARAAEMALAGLPAPASRSSTLIRVVAICLLGLATVAATANLLPETLDAYALRQYFVDVYGREAGKAESSLRATILSWLLATAVVAVPNLAVLLGRGRLSAAVKGAIVGCEAGFAGGVTLLRVTGTLSPQALAFSVLEFAILSLNSLAVFSLAAWLVAQADLEEERGTASTQAADARQAREEARAAQAACRRELLAEQRAIRLAERRHLTNQADQALWEQTASLAYLQATQQLAIAACGSVGDGDVPFPTDPLPALPPHHGGGDHER